MALREFADADGHRWTAWDVSPSRNYDNLLPGFRDQVPSTGASWLAFECKVTRERRRLAPVPRDWSSCTDAELVALCGRATLIPRRRQRIIE